MADDTSMTIIVLKKTKLGETDLIITGFSSEGHQVRAVAKGARRPGSKLGVHLELYSQARVLVTKGRSLGIITEAQTVASHEDVRSSVLHSAAAAAIVELLDKISADSDGDARLFLLVSEALRSLGGVGESALRLICAAALLKIASQAGVRPSLKHCVSCGCDCHASNVEVVETERDQGSPRSAKTLVGFSYPHGGVICSNCLMEHSEEEYIFLDMQLIEWANVLITSRFRDLEANELVIGDGPECDDLGQILLQFSREWLRYHLVDRLKSLDFLLSFR